jgi:hypothetical protein
MADCSRGPNGAIAAGYFIQRAALTRIPDIATPLKELS